MEQYDANDLLIFARVAEAGSFSRAAERMGLPKSTVSRRISALEERFKERLILRTTRRLTLTELGVQLLDHARLVAEEVDAARALGEHRQTRPSGRLRVSMPSDFASLLLTDMLAAFTALHPDVSLELDLSPRRVDILGEGFDLAIRMGELADDATLVARRIAAFPGGLYAAPNYINEHGEPTEPQDLLTLDGLLLGRAGEIMEWRLESASREWRGIPRTRIVANSPELLIHLARGEAGIAAVPDYFAAGFVHRGELRRVLRDWSLPAFPAWAVFPGRRLMPAKTRAFMEMLQMALGPADQAPRPASTSGS